LGFRRRNMKCDLRPNQEDWAHQRLIATSKEWSSISSHVKIEEQAKKSKAVSRGSRSIILNLDHFSVTIIEMCFDPLLPSEERYGETEEKILG
jgi:hypothetical protein